MKYITTQEANSYLSDIGMEIGTWNQIADHSRSKKNDNNWIKYKAPKAALELFCFSRHVAGWLPKGDWKIFQVDNSTSLSQNELSIFFGLPLNQEGSKYFFEKNSFLFKFGEDKSINSSTELIISNIIYLFLLFECHGQVVSSNSSVGQRISIQDGFVYFFSKDKSMSGADILLKNYELNRLLSPNWVIDIIAENQDKNL